MSATSRRQDARSASVVLDEEPGDRALPSPRPSVSPGTWDALLQAVADDSPLGTHPDDDDIGQGGTAGESLPQVAASSPPRVREAAMSRHVDDNARFDPELDFENPFGPSRTPPEPEWAFWGGPRRDDFYDEVDDIDAYNYDLSYRSENRARWTSPPHAPPVSQRPADLAHSRLSLPDSLSRTSSTSSTESPSSFSSSSDGDAALIVNPSAPASAAMPASQRNKRKSGTAGTAPASSSKRRKSNTSTNATTIEEVDLIDVNDESGLVKLLQKQREEQIKALQAGSQDEGDAAPRMSTLQCVICLEPPKNLTTTSCGHLFCHTCLMEALIAGEQNSTSRCPVCRTPVQRLGGAAKSAGGRGKHWQALELKVVKRSRKGKERETAGREVE